MGSCVIQSHSTQQSNLPSFLTVNIKVNYENSGKATFRITNKSEQKQVYLFHPEEIEIEKQTKEGWKQVEILYCPCGASCPPPPEWSVLNPQSSETVTWNLKKQWCGGTSLHGNIPKTKTKYAGKGNYRFVVRYTLDKDKKTKTYYKNFQLEAQ